MRLGKKLTGVIIALAILGLAYFVGFRVLNFGSPKVQASALGISTSDKAPFLYEFSASTFKLFMGEEEEKPLVRIGQGSRILDFLVDRLGPSGEDAEATSSATPTPLPTAIPTPLPTENSNISSESASVNFLDFISKDAVAQESIALVDEETEPSIDYAAAGFNIKPALDKIFLTFSVDNSNNLPILDISSERLFAQKENDQIVFYTRTDRKAFSLESAKATDANGEEITLSLSISNNIISFTGGEVWLADPAREYPVVISAELVSRFHDKMLPVWPARPSFKASESLEFDVNTLGVDDMNIRDSLFTDELSDLRFGLIDAKGETHELVAVVLGREVDLLTLEMKLTEGGVRAGIFDLLIQYKNNAAFIAQEDFSWGVLAINPDMSVYPTGSIAQIDMAVLDKLGEMVCDADLLLKIENPDGDISELSTVNGDIEVSETCFILMTEKPDYRTTYRTTSDGVYTMTLSAVTKEGSFTIKDEFEVNSSSPLYVRRVGPTRIYPVLEYEMALEIIGGTEFGEIRVTEKVPKGFEITNLGGGVEKEAGKHKEITWEINVLEEGKQTVSYAFDAPDISPALFLLGPARITRAGLGLELFSEKRPWQIASDAIGVENSNSATFDETTNPTVTLTVSSATLLIVQVNERAGNTVTISDDSGSNTYSSTHVVTNTVRIEQFYVNGPAAGSPLTITVNGTTITGSVGAFGLTGTDTTTPIDASSKASGTGTTTPATAAITTDQNNSWIVSLLGQDSNSVLTEDASQDPQVWEQISGGGKKTCISRNNRIKSHLRFK